MAEEYEKKKKHTGRNVTAGVLAALLLGLGGWYGFGVGGGDGILGGGETNSGTEQTQSAETGDKEPAPEPEPAGETEDAEASDDGVMLIEVRENTVTVNGTEVEPDGLEAFLRDNYQDGVSVTLRDSGAIKATYDEVSSALTKLDISYEIG